MVELITATMIYTRGGNILGNILGYMEKTYCETNKNAFCLRNRSSIMPFHNKFYKYKSAMKRNYWLQLIIFFTLNQFKIKVFAIYFSANFLDYRLVLQVDTRWRKTSFLSTIFLNPLKRQGNFSNYFLLLVILTTVYIYMVA